MDRRRRGVVEVEGQAMKVTIDGAEYTMVTNGNQPFDQGTIWWIYEAKEAELS